eukprot:333374-Chlamydomonas_euryale.AAC.6
MVACWQPCSHELYHTVMQPCSHAWRVDGWIDARRADRPLVSGYTLDEPMGGCNQGHAVRRQILFCMQADG